jgi:exodeoxyribonuclease-3
MKIATFNVNSIKARLDQLLAWLKQAVPEVVCLQEIKCTDDTFPREPIEELGFKLAVHGQKTYNGVAILSKYPLEDVSPRLPGNAEDDHARYLEAVIGGPEPLRVASLYVPNGNPVGTDKYAYKLAWLERLTRHTQELLALEEPLIMAGDYNVIPSTEDVYDPEAWRNDALFARPSRHAFNAFTALGLSDAFRACDTRPGQYTFWDYQAGAWQKNQGLRIDHLMLSPQAADRLKAAGIDRAVRAWERPSDHVPVWCELGA